MKKFSVKIYDKTGENYVDTLTNLRDEPRFTNAINGGQGQLVFDLNSQFDLLQSGLEYLNIVKIYVNAEGSEDATLIYTGYISQLTPYISGGQEGVRVTVLGLVSLLGRAYYKDEGSLTVTHTNEDPADIFKAIIDHFQSVYPALITYTAESIEEVGTPITYTLESKNWAEAIKGVFNLVGEGFYWNIDENGVFWFKKKPTTATHTFTVGKDIKSLQAPTDSEKVKNSIILEYSGGTETGSDATSISAYHLCEIVIKDNDISDSTTAQQRVAKELSDRKNKKIKTTLEIGDNYPIESIKVGETCKILNISIGQNVFSDNMLITAVAYTMDSVNLTLDEFDNFGTTLQEFIS